MIGRRLAYIAAAATIWLAAHDPAAAQGLLRSQTNRIQNAIQNQIRQAVKPILAVRNSAGEGQALSLSPEGRDLAIVLHDNTAPPLGLRSGLAQVRFARPSGRFRANR